MLKMHAEERTSFHESNIFLIKIGCERKYYENSATSNLMKIPSSPFELLHVDGQVYLAKLIGSF